MSSPLSDQPSLDTTLVAETPENGKRKPKDTSSDEPDRKRVRVTRSSRHANFTRHPVFWAEDGSVLLQFGETRLRLHRTRLTQHSKWFEELFDNKDVMSNEGVPLGILWTVEDGVDLFQLDGTGVSIWDFEALLTSMEDGLKYCYTKPPFVTVVSLVRASTFFKFETTYLEDMFSDDVEDVTKETLSVPHAALALVLGRDWDLPQSLKRAFYELARAPQVETSILEDNLSINILDKKDLVLLLNLQKRLMAAWVKILAYRRLSCPSSPACTRRRAIIVNSVNVQDYRCDPIKGMNALKSHDWKGLGLCSSCVEGRLKWLDEQKEELWQDIDEWLDLSTDGDA